LVLPATNSILNPSGNLKVRAPVPEDKPPVDGVFIFSVLSLQALKQMTNEGKEGYLSSSCLNGLTIYLYGRKIPAYAKSTLNSIYFAN
jgi:hypothetical protein